MTRAPLTFLDATHVRQGQRVLLYFGGSNYLGLAWHPVLRRALASATLQGPSNTGASRRTTGEHAAYLRVERSIARFFQADDAAFVATGYLAPLAAAQALRASVTDVFVDVAAHACLQDAARLLGRPVRTFTVAELARLRRGLTGLRAGACPLVITDGTSGVGAGVAPLREYLRELPKRGWLLVDDAHGAGAVGPGGRGAVAGCGIRDARVVVTVTFSKAFAVGGAAVLGSRELVRRVRESAPAVVGSTGPLLPVVAAVETVLRCLDRSPARVERLHANVRKLVDALPDRPEIRCDPRTPVVAVSPNSPARTRALKAQLLRAGIYPTWIQYLQGPSTGFFRFAVSSEHRRAEIAALACVLRAAFP